MQANPDLTPAQVQAILKATGDHSALPDTFYGWGIYDVWQAVQMAHSGISGPPHISLPSGFQVWDAWPNPFNPFATFRFQMPTPGQVSLRIYDTAGRLVATLIDNRMTAGLHAATFNGAGLSSGIYVYRLEAGKYVAAGKLALVK